MRLPQYRIIHGIIGLKIVNVVLIHYFKADEEGTRLRGTVEITGIAELALSKSFWKLLNIFCTPVFSWNLMWSCSTKV